MAPPTHFIPQNMWAMFKDRGEVAYKPPMGPGSSADEGALAGATTTATATTITGVASLLKEFETGPPPPRHHDPTPADLKAQRKKDKEEKHAEVLKERAAKCE